MALIVEDGTRPADADSYLSVTDIESRLSLLGLTVYAGKLAAEKETIARRATLDLDATLADFVEGEKVSSTQSLLFPRDWCFARDLREFRSNEIPEQLLKALPFRCEDRAAGRSGIDSIAAQGIKRHKESSKEIEYFQDGGFSLRRSSPDAYRAVLPLIWVGS